MNPKIKAEEAIDIRDELEVLVEQLFETYTPDTQLVAEALNRLCSVFGVRQPMEKLEKIYEEKKWQDLSENLAKVQYDSWLENTNT